MNTSIVPITFAVGILLLATYVGFNEAFGTNDTSDIPDTVTLGEPNTVITFCEWIYTEDFVDCVQDRFWHNDNYEVIRQETSHYFISIEDYRSGEL